MTSEQKPSEEAMRVALETAAKAFQWYGDLHAAKPDPDKAKRNYDLAEQMRAALKASDEVGEPVAWLYEGDDGSKELLLDCNGEYARRFLENSWAETPLYKGAVPDERAQIATFQPRVDAWMDACFGDAIKANALERADRFIEEAIELAQTNPHFSADRAHALVDYVFNRPIGAPSQEVGGVMVTLAALCNAAGLDMEEAAETELARIWTKVDAIRAKQAAKPVGSALPVAIERGDHLPKAMEANHE